MKVLVVCNHGKNRSVYLRDYLRSKGYEADAYSVKTEDIAEQVTKHDVVVSVHPDILKKLEAVSNLSDKRVISLDIEDRPGEVLEKKGELDGDAWIEFQNEYVYPKLIEQMNKHLPL